MQYQNDQQRRQQNNLRICLSIELLDLFNLHKVREATWLHTGMTRYLKVDGSVISQTKSRKEWTVSVNKSGKFTMESIFKVLKVGEINLLNNVSWEMTSPSLKVFLWNPRLTKANCKTFSNFKESKRLKGQIFSWNSRSFILLKCSYLYRLSAWGRN